MTGPTTEPLAMAPTAGLPCTTGQHHRLRDQNDAIKRRVATWDSENQTANVRAVEVMNVLPLSLYEAFQLSRKLFSNERIAIAAGDNDWIWMRLKPETNATAWGNSILLKRDGRLIPASRGL